MEEIVVSFVLSESSNKSLEPLLDGLATLEHMSAMLPFKFPASGKYDAILDSLVTTTTTMHVRAAKVMFDVIVHKVYCHWPEQSVWFWFCGTQLKTALIFIYLTPDWAVSSAVPYQHGMLLRASQLSGGVLNALLYM